MINAKATRTIFGAIVVFLAMPATSASTAEGRPVAEYLCKDIMRENGSQRDVAIAFLHGFALGRSGSSLVVAEEMRAQTTAFTDRCLDNPNEVAIDAMMKSRKP